MGPQRHVPTEASPHTAPYRLAGVLLLPGFRVALPAWRYGAPSEANERMGVAALSPGNPRGTGCSGSINNKTKAVPRSKGMRSACRASWKDVLGSSRVTRLTAGTRGRKTSPESQNIVGRSRGLFGGLFGINYVWQNCHGNTAPSGFSPEALRRGAGQL